MVGKLHSITISRQIGSSGAPMGNKLSERLGIPFFDCEILKRASDRLHRAQADLAHREPRPGFLSPFQVSAPPRLRRARPGGRRRARPGERPRSFWQSVWQTAERLDPALNLTADRYIPNDRELFQLESETILRVAEKSSAVFIGRCGRHILRDHPRHIRPFL